MNKNTVAAFLLILVSVMFFTSPTYNKFYTEKILKKEYVPPQPKSVPEVIRTEEKEIKEDVKNSIKETSPENEELREATDLSADSSETVVQTDTIWIENDKIRIGVQTMGALIVSIQMKEYTAIDQNRQKTVIDLLEKTECGAAQTTIGNKSYDKVSFRYVSGEKHVVVNNKTRSLEFEYEDNNGNLTKKIFELSKESYFINLSVVKNSLPGERIRLGWDCGIVESEKMQQKNQAEQKMVHFYNGDNVQHLQMKKVGVEETTGQYKWIGVTSKYFFIAINNDSLFDSDLKITSIEGQSVGKMKTFNYALEMSRIAEKQQESYSIYAGPTKIEELKKHKVKYEKVLFPVIGWTKIFFWADRWFPILAEWTLLLLIAIQKIVKDYGVVIIVLTIITRIVTYPMTHSSMKSMEKMKDIQPKVEKIRSKHKNNPQKMNEEIMALYKKEGVNPLNPGCLPIFLQMPVFIALFVVLRKAIEMRGARTFIIPWIKDLSQPEVLISLESILPNGLPMYGSNIALLPIIMALLTFFQQKMTIKDPNQKMMIYFMPIFMLVLFNSFPSGLVLYWTFSSAVQLVQQIIMERAKKG